MICKNDSQKYDYNVIHKNNSQNWFTKMILKKMTHNIDSQKYYSEKRFTKIS